MVERTRFREEPRAGEEVVFRKLVDVTREQMKKHGGFFRRGQHAKGTGCAAAEFRVSDTVPDACQWGVFRQPGRTFEALVRFSNSDGTIEADGKGTGRGAAVKLLDVEGARAIPGQTDRSQDFLMVDFPVFPFATPEEYPTAIRLRGLPFFRNLPFKLGLLPLGVYLLINREAKAVIDRITTQKLASPLESTYWSESPYWLGDAEGVNGQAVKYVLVPRSPGSPVPDNPEDQPADYLHAAFVDHLTTRDAVFDFRVQVQGDPRTMPVEDSRAEWDEAASRPITVATLRVPRQEAARIAEADERCEGLSFNPWQALAEHRPIGGMNRLRRHVYEAGFGKRRAG